jgi:hypothetical protein
MRPKSHYGPVTIAGALLLTGLTVSSSSAAGWASRGTPPGRSLVPTTASTAAGQATAAQAVLLGPLGTVGSTTLASTGISAANSESDVAQLTGSIPSLLSAEVLNAATYSYPGQVDSVASIANIGLTVGGVIISADSAVARASQVLGAAGSGGSYIDNLTIDGVPVSVTGSPNQTIPIAGGQIVLNEQSVSSSGGALVNAIHVTVNGVVDVVLASARASIS